jgi:hypothetical protein
VNHLLPFWNYRLSFSLTLVTGGLLLWQYPGAKGTAGHITRWALALFLSVSVVYMNTAIPRRYSIGRRFGSRIPGTSA